MPDETLTHAEARAILGLASHAGPEALIGAFRTAVKDAHPDRPGGDAERFRAVLEAYRLLRAAPSPHVATLMPLVGAYVEVALPVALAGGDAIAVLADGRRVAVQTPPGVRAGEVLRFEGEQVVVRILDDEAAQVRGSDLWITAPVAPALLAEGGRAAIPTPVGEKALWITRKVAERGLIRLEGEGLPARNDHPQGDLFIRLVPRVGAPESAARAQLRRFAAAWAA